MTYETEAELREEITHLGDIIAGLVGVNDPTVDGLTKSESRIVRALESADGRVVSRSALMDAVYFDRFVDSVPENKIIDVFVCKIGPKRRDIHDRIFGIHSVGYRLVPA